MKQDFQGKGLRPEAAKLSSILWLAAVLMGCPTPSYAEDDASVNACGAQGADVAIAHAQQVAEKKPVDVKIFNDAVAICIKVALDQSHSAEDRARAYGNIGTAYEGLDDTDKAIAYYSKSIATSKNYRAYFLRGSLFYKLKRIDDAISDLNNAVSAKDSGMWAGGALAELGVIYNEKEEYDLAIAYLSKAIDSGSKNNFSKVTLAKYYHNRGVVWENKGNSERAQQDYSEEIELKMAR